MLHYSNILINYIMAEMRCGISHHNSESVLCVVAVEKGPEEPKGSSSYVPPHLRNQPKEPSHASKCIV